MRDLLDPGSTASGKLQQCAAPGQAAAKGDHQHAAAGADAPLFLQFAEHQGDAGRGGIAVALDILVVFLGGMRYRRTARSMIRALA